VDKRAKRRPCSASHEELRDKIILSFSAAGRVSDTSCAIRVGFRVTDAKGAQVYLPTAKSSSPGDTGL